jgi:hypothetical protein
MKSYWASFAFLQQLLVSLADVGCHPAVMPGNALLGWVILYVHSGHASMAADCSVCMHALNLFEI